MFKHASAKYLPACLLGLFLLVTASTGLAWALSDEENEPFKITGCYSNLAYHEESGDLLGWELFIVFSSDTYHVLFQESEGWPTVLLLLPLKVEGSSIRFTVPRAAGGQEFTGTVSAAGITGRFADLNQEIFLPRKPSYWQ